MADGQLLVVDDEHEITDLLEEHLRTCGYAVDVAHDGRAALQIAAARRPDAVLLDITMPGLDGEEVLARLRAFDPTVAVVMLTGNDDEALARRLLRAGAFDYLPKPFRLEVLERVVTAAVAAGRRS
jgi:DNA-binding response OmpR family regulator